MEDRVQSVKVTNKKTGTVYELDFNRDAVRFAEARGFDTSDIQKYPTTKIPELFYYSFRMHHKAMAKNQTDKLLEELGGLPSNVLWRLIDLYNQAGLTNVIQTEEESEKNENADWEL